MRLPIVSGIVFALLLIYTAVDPRNIFHRSKDFTVGHHKTVCTYFEPIGTESFSDYDELLKLWEKSWVKQGWQARIMTKADAVLHPRFKEIQEMLLKLPTVNVVEYEQSCYLRWVAAIATGCRVTHPSFDPYFHGILR
jgi:hypothetical protein